MWQTPTTESKPTVEGARAAAVPELQRTLHPCYSEFGALVSPASQGSWMGARQSHQQIARLQRAAGNQAVLRMLSRSAPAIQTKLTINQPGDQYEQEADRVAEQVMRMPDPMLAPDLNAKEQADSLGAKRRALASASATGAARLQRKCAYGSSTEGGTACPDCEKDRLMRPGEGAARAAEAPPTVHGIIRTPGRPLDPAIRAFMEPRFRTSFAHIRTHQDADSAESARSVNALAYTVGSHIVLGAGIGAQSVDSKRRIFAHELTHTLQQNSQVRLARAPDPSPPQPSSREHRDDTKHVPTKGRCGPAEIGSPTGCSFVQGDRASPKVPDQGFYDEELFRFKVGCDEFLTSGDEQRLERLPKATAKLGATYVIHGFASEEGSPQFNIRLSCARANRAAELLNRTIKAKQLLHVYAYGSVPGKRADRRAVVVQILKPPPIRKTLTLVSWINPSTLPDFDCTRRSLFVSLAKDEGSKRVLHALGMILRATANSAPDSSLPESSIPSFLARKEYRAFQHYALMLHPLTMFTSADTIQPQIIAGYTKPSTCDRFPPSTFMRGELSPLNRVAYRFNSTHPNLDSLVKYRVSAQEEEAGIKEGTSFPGWFLLTRSMLLHVPWVWTQTGMIINPSTSTLLWRIVASAFPTTTIYVDGKRVAEIPQKDPSVLLGPHVRRADQPRETRKEEEQQGAKPLSEQVETVRMGGTAEGEN